VRPFPEAARIRAPESLAAALEAAARALPVYDGRDDYDLAVQAAVHDAVRAADPDGFDRLTAAIRARFAAPPFSAVVAGLRWDDHHRLFVAVNRAFGDLVAVPYRPPRGQLVHHVQPATDLTAAAGHQQTERLHTDCADWPEPARYMSLLCVRPDPRGGGRSRLLEVATLREEVRARAGAEALRLAEEPVPWRVADYLGGGVVWRPVLTASTVRWRRYTIDDGMAAAAAGGGAALPPERVAALDAIEAAVEGAPGTLEFLLGPGELWIADNARVLHGRTAILDPARSGRLLLRSWIRPADAAGPPGAAGPVGSAPPAGAAGPAPPRPAG
jgi:hypothetical protein